MKKRWNIYSTIACVILILLIVCLVGIISARAYESEPYYQERMDKAHWMADCMRSLGWDQGTPGQQAALKECGYFWHTNNDARKELIAIKQQEAQRAAEEREYLGNWTLTAYANDGVSASGRANIPGQTCACNCLPFGTVIEVEGIGRWTVTDRGASSGAWSWHNSNWADLYMNSNAECNQWGVQHRDVYLVK